MAKPQVAEPLVRALHSDKFNTEQLSLVRSILRAEMSIPEHAAALLEQIDVSNKQHWPMIITLARRVGINDDEMQHELGASTSTIHRWLKEGVAPREGTRRLMKGALLSLAKKKVQSVKAIQKKIGTLPLQQVNEEGRSLQDA